MYRCPECKQQIELTIQQESVVADDKEVNIKCRCGFLNIMVGADYDSELGGYQMYSYEANKR